MTMTTTYQTNGQLTEPVTDLSLAREFLREHGAGIAQYIYPDAAKPGVHSVTWDLLDEGRWQVTLVADRDLPAEQLALLSEWISGQNSDGLGEGFEQQAFAEHGYDDDDFTMSSFDWETNDCALVEVRS
jgi:hypothetical protein